MQDIFLPFLIVNLEQTRSSTIFIPQMFNAKPAQFSTPLRIIAIK